MRLHKVLTLFYDILCHEKTTFTKVISRDTITKILDTARIDEVVGDFLTLKKRGVNLLANCPFHNEKTPSFTVSPAKGIYKCFGCGASGNSVNFVMEHEHYSYPEALRYLANKYHIEIEETESPRNEDQEERNLHESLYIVNTFAQKYYSQQLLETEEGSIGLAYFKERGFTNDTIQKFQLGYAPAAYDAFTKEALAKGYQLEILQKAGLTSTKEERHFDFFRDRVQFTIHNFVGKVVGFGGRTLKSDKKIPKYINTPESEVYNKSKILYGIFFAKNAIRKQDECILVEGYTDVISLVQAGIENVAASSGTSLTVEQIRLIRRLTTNITILYDGDAAGIKAALRGIDLVLEEDMNVKVVLLPPEDDPDSFVKREGASAFIRYKQQQEKDFILFKTEYLLKDAQNDPVKKTEAIKDIVHSVSLVPDTIKRSLYIRECSQLLDMDERILITEVNKERRKRVSKTTGIEREELLPVSNETPETQEPQETIGEDPLTAQEKDIIRLLLEFGNAQFDEGIYYAQIILNELEDPNLQFSEMVCNQILQEYREALQNGIIPEQYNFTHHSEQEVQKFAIDILHSHYEVSGNWEKMHDTLVTPKMQLAKKDITSSISRYKQKQIAKLLKQNLLEMSKLGPEDEAHKEELLRKHVRLKEADRQLHQITGTVIKPDYRFKDMEPTPTGGNLNRRKDNPVNMPTDSPASKPDDTAETIT
ncbi:MAG: DNA primase [Chitinophagales bacterium]|nr:DNA primase [Chitinophagales bacterium]